MSELETRNILDENDNVIGTLSAPIGTSEAEWEEKLSIYRSNHSPSLKEVIKQSFRVHPLQYQLIGQMNYDQYLYSNSHAVNLSMRSGGISNGYRYGNSAPLTALYSGKVVSATASITGVAQSTGSPAAFLELKFELWKVGFNEQGTKLGDIIFSVDSSQYTIGNWWDSSILTGFSESQNQNVNVSAGDLLALKFIRQTGNNKVVAVTNTTIVLEIEGNA